MTRLINRHLIAAFTIAAFSFALRLYRLYDNIPSLYADEVTGSFQSLYTPHLSAGVLKDLFAKVFSTTIHYSWLFGLTPLGARFASALYGSLIPLAIFFLVRSISSKTFPGRITTAFLSSLLTAVLPWSFMISRIGHASVPIIVLLSCCHLTLLVNAKKISSYIFSLIPLMIGMVFYPSLVVIVPVVSVFVLFLLMQNLNLVQKYQISLIFFMLIIPLGLMGINRYQLLNKNSRGQDLAIWNDVNVAADSNYYRGLSRLSTPTIFSFNSKTEIIANKILYNHPISVIRVFTRNYLSFFSPDFLFFKGDNILRHSTGMVGEFFPFLIPFMIFGAFVFFKNANKKFKSIFLIWILVSPIPAAITKDGATYLLRVITLMPLLTYFCALGIESSFDLFKNRLVKIVYGCFIFIIGAYSVYSFMFSYFHVYPAISAPHWEYGFKELADFQTENPGKLLIIWEDKYPVWYFCFWQKLPSSICDQQKVNAFEMTNNSRVDFPINDLLFSLPQNEKDLNLIIQKYQPQFVAIPEKYLPIFPSFKTKHQVVQAIKYPDQTVAFSIYEIGIVE